MIKKMLLIFVFSVMLNASQNIKFHQKAIIVNIGGVEYVIASYNITSVYKKESSELLSNVLKTEYRVGFYGYYTDGIYFMKVDKASYEKIKRMIIRGLE